MQKGCSRLATWIALSSMRCTYVTGKVCNQLALDSFSQADINLALGKGSGAVGTSPSLMPIEEFSCK